MRNIKDTDLIQVRNRNNGSTGYTLDNNFHRNFEPGATKKVPFSELKELQYAPGGEYILENYLVIEDQDALDLLNMTVEPEYFYDEESVRKILFQGTLDEFADFLDFAPAGALEIAKDIAVKEEIPDVRKRDKLSKKTGLNINNAIMVNKVMAEETPAEVEAPKQRRVQNKEVETEAKAPARKASVPQYKIVDNK